MSQLTQVLIGTDNPIDTLTGNSGGAVGPSAGNVNVIGAGGVTVAGNAGTHTLTISVSGGGMTWAVTTVDAPMVVNNGYIANKAGLLTMTLPASASIGDILQMTGINNATGWKIAQNANQQIFFGTSSTTVGVGGSLASTQTRDSLELLCVVSGASTVWNVLSSIGNITVV